MIYENVIPFEGRTKAVFPDFRRSSLLTPSTTTTPMMGPLEVQSATTPRNEAPAPDAEVLFEQLAYLIQFADQERNRLDRVKAILLETFN
jgi:hypothetical protein